MEPNQWFHVEPLVPLYVYSAGNQVLVPPFGTTGSWFLVPGSFPFRSRVQNHKRNHFWNQEPEEEPRNQDTNWNQCSYVGARAIALARARRLVELGLCPPPLYRAQPI